MAARKFVPSLHPRDRFGRFTRSRSAQASTQDRQQAATVAQALKPKRGVTGAKAGAYLDGIAADDHRDAVADYTAGGYIGIHKALRAGRADDPGVRAMDAAMIELPDDLIVSRRVPVAQFGTVDLDALVGLKVRDAAYAPTSIGAVRATKRDVRLRIAVPKGTRAAVNPDTGEVILDRDLDMVIAGVERGPGGNADVFLTVLPKAGTSSARPAAKPDRKTTTKPAPPQDGNQPDDGGEIRADLMKLRVPELRARMRERGLKPGRMRKSQMIDALIADEFGDEPDSTDTPADSDAPDWQARFDTAITGQSALDLVPLSLNRTETHAKPDSTDGLTADERSAVIGYQGYEYALINGALRGEDDNPSETITGYIRHLDVAMGKSRLPADVVTQRGIRRVRNMFGDRLDGDMTGMEWREDAYMSTTTDPLVIESFVGGTGGLRMRVFIPAGTGAVQVSGAFDENGHSDESEILIERGRTLRVVADHGIGADGIRDVDVEVVAA